MPMNASGDVIVSTLCGLRDVHCNVPVHSYVLTGNEVVHGWQNFFPGSKGGFLRGLNGVRGRAGGLRGYGWSVRWVLKCPGSFLGVP